MRNLIKKILLKPFDLLYLINPILEQKMMFVLKCHHRLNCKNPKTYNEKVNWLKMFYRNDLMPICADKLRVREYIVNCGFEKYLPSLLWHGDNPDDIPFEKLPNSFVIKITNGSGGNIFVRDKHEIDVTKIKRILKKWLKEKYLLAYGEWHYQKISSSIIIEELLVEKNRVAPIDYKLFYFNGLKVNNGIGCVAVDTGRFVDHRRNIYDGNWKFLNDVSFGFKLDREIIEKPVQFETMKKIAQKLSKPFPHCRVDFYIINNKLYIGEITFFNGAGYDLITPLKYNVQMGDWINLSDLGDTYVQQ